ncbi:hypothetical protein IGJ02_000149 [Enterococcus sp. DIV0724b]|uniref:DUF5067 domain-containing protein n=1 Tax=Enterococcus sp. DIV0724b TaxID=2774694 RepID=UPI003D2FA7B4
MKKITTITLSIVTILFFLSGCTKILDKTKQQFQNKGVSYEMQLPAAWKPDKEVKNDYRLQTIFSAEDMKSNSYLFIITSPVKEVTQKGFGEQTRKKLQERYNYKKLKDVYMKKFKVGNYPAYKYTLNTKYDEKSVWAHFYYIWTEHGFVQMTFYSADDNSYEKRSEKIDSAVATFKETGFDEKEAEQEQELQKKEEGDVVTIANDELKIETTAVRRVTGVDKKKFLAIRYTFTNLSEKAIQPSVWGKWVTAKQGGQTLSLGNLPEDTSFLDIKELVATQSKEVQQGESVESVVLYELSDTSTVELSFSQDVFPGQEPTRVVVPE